MRRILAITLVTVLAIVLSFAGIAHTSHPTSKLAGTLHQPLTPQQAANLARGANLDGTCPSAPASLLAAPDRLTAAQIAYYHLLPRGKGGANWAHIIATSQHRSCTAHSQPGVYFGFNGTPPSASAAAPQNDTTTNWEGKWTYYTGEGNGGQFNSVTGTLNQTQENATPSHAWVWGSWYGMSNVLTGSGHLIQDGLALYDNPHVQFLRYAWYEDYPSASQYAFATGNEDKIFETVGVNYTGPTNSFDFYIDDETTDVYGDYTVNDQISWAGYYAEIITERTNITANYLCNCKDTAFDDAIVYQAGDGSYTASDNWTQDDLVNGYGSHLASVTLWQAGDDPTYAVDLTTHYLATH